MTCNFKPQMASTAFPLKELSKNPVIQGLETLLGGLITWHNEEEEILLQENFLP